MDQDIEQEINPFSQLFTDLNNKPLENLIPLLEPSLVENPFAALVVYESNMAVGGGSGGNPPPPTDLTFK